eukprot:3130675-Rhodomonas_salina.3
MESQGNTMAIQTPTTEFRHPRRRTEMMMMALLMDQEAHSEGGEELRSTVELSNNPDGHSDCTTSCGSEMTSISKRVLREAPQHPTVKNSSYTQMYLGTSASLRSTSAQRLKTALFTKVLSERKEKQMLQETKKRRNHNVKLWLSDADNFPDPTVDEVQDVAGDAHLIQARGSSD